MGALAAMTRRASGATAPALDLIRASNNQETRATSGLQNPASWLFDALTEGTTSAGVQVGPTSAARHADVYACVRVLADAVSSLPLVVYRRTTEGRERAPESLPAQVLTRPSPLLTQSGLSATLMAHLLLWGNAYLAKLRDGSGRVQRLFPIDPSRVTVTVTYGEPAFHLDANETDTQSGTFTRRDILHVKAMSLDGYCGLSPIHQARQAIGLGIALEDFAATWFKNSSFPGGVIQMPGTLSDEAAGRLKRDWEAFHRGLSNSSRVAVLEGGASFQSVSIPPEDAQFVEQRRLSSTMIARIFRVPPWMIGADSGSSMTYSNVEQQMLQFAVYSVRPWLVTLEQALAADTDLFFEGDLYPEFLMDALLRADTATRAQAYSLAFGKWMTPNEIREKENLPALEGGDELTPSAPEAPAPAMPEGEARGVTLIAPEREERMVRSAVDATRDAILYGLHEMGGALATGLNGLARETRELQRAVTGQEPPPAPVVNVTVPKSPPPVVNVAPAAVTVNVPQQPAPQVHVTVPPEPPRQIVLKRDASGRLKSATIEEA